jgi:hypothetical protein
MRIAIALQIYSVRFCKSFVIRHNIKMDLIRTWCNVDWIHLHQDTVQECHDNEYSGSIKTDNFLNRRVTISFSYLFPLPHRSVHR